MEGPTSNRPISELRVSFPILLNIWAFQRRYIFCAIFFLKIFPQLREIVFLKSSRVSWVAKKLSVEFFVVEILIFFGKILIFWKFWFLCVIFQIFWIFWKNTYVLKILICLWFFRCLDCAGSEAWWVTKTWYRCWNTQ